MSDWQGFASSVRTHVDSLSESGCDLPFFRGHSRSEWQLLCGLGRQSPSEYKKQNIESIIYYDYLSFGGGILGKNADSWDILFSMQHHGLPTRLLDWTTTFSAALYFAMKPYLFMKNFPELNKFPYQPCVWILDPFELNRMGGREPSVANPYLDFESNYHSTFIENQKELGADVVAINPPQHTPRQSAQRSVFTLHHDLFTPLENMKGAPLKKFDLPVGSVQEAASFLALAGVNEFTIFPDLDGLARHLMAEHVSWL